LKFKKKLRDLATSLTIARISINYNFKCNYEDILEFARSCAK